MVVRKRPGQACLQVVWAAACLATWALVCANTASALTLDELLAQASARDSQLRAARHDLAAAQARLDQARGSLWPQLNLTANANRTRQQLAYDEGRLPERSDQFSTRGYNLQLTQAVYRREDMARRAGAERVVAQLQAQVQAAEQALRVRAVQPWFEACQHDHLVHAATADVARQQARSAALARRLARGDLSPHDAALADADLALAQARWTEAESERAQRLFQLSGLAGTPVAMGDVDCVAPVAPAADAPPDADLQAWLQAVADHSPELSAARQAVAVAQAQLQLASGGHGPSLDVVASKGWSQQGPTASLSVGSKARTDSVGLQLSVPVFAGGAVSAREREAVAQIAKAEAELDGLALRLRQDAASNWRSLQVAQAHMQAADQRVAALQAQQQAVARRLAQGLALEADELAAQQELAAALAERTRMAGLATLARVKLAAQAGLGAPLPPPSPPLAAAED